MAVTLSWTGDDSSKTWLGCSWTNGETKNVCPEQYGNWGTTEGEDWAAEAGAYVQTSLLAVAPGCSTGSAKLTCRFPAYVGGKKIRMYIINGPCYNRTYNNGLSTFTPTKNALTYSGDYVNSNWEGGFTSATTSDNEKISISWVRVSGTGWKDGY